MDHGPELGRRRRPYPQLMEVTRAGAILAVSDFNRSLAFYRDQLGFAIAREYGAGTVFYAGQSLIELDPALRGQGRRRPARPVQAGPLRRPADPRGGPVAVPAA